MSANDLSGMTTFIPEYITIHRFSTKTRFIRRISVASNAIETIDNKRAYLIIYCLNCIRRDGNSTYIIPFIRFVYF